ncbi:MAG: P-loop NTPase [Clostridia bacterium]|nr:P-loop NTPase [Clostridia bacterium]
MKIAIASGKGGTGKTTLATNLAYFLSEKENVTLLDCDVEEPNGHIFIKPEWVTEEKCYLPIPQVNEDKCTHCGLCSQACQFSAIAQVKDKILTFPELCHGCGLCALLCPSQAITEGFREIGTVQIGKKNNLNFIHGKLRVSEAMSPPLIKEVKKQGKNRGITIIDAPPGTSCPVIQSIVNSDFVILVTEPTPFGLNDLELAVGMVKELNIPMAVAINRADIGDNRVQEFCAKENIPVIMEIPHSYELARCYSQGNLAVQELPEYKGYLQRIWDGVKKELAR